METSGLKMMRVKKLSPAVMSRIRNGHKVRLMEGEGTQLVVRPDQFDAISKSFLKKKGIQIALSPSEIEANRSVEGEGIFGKKADKVMKKLGVKKVAYAVGNVVKPLVKEGISKVAMAAEMYGVPSSVTDKLEATANQYLDDPKSLQGKKGVRELKKRAIDMGIEAAAPMAAQYGIDVNELKDTLKAAKSAPTSKKEMKAAVRGKAEGAVLGKLQQMVDARRSASAPMPVSTDLYSQFDSDGIIGNGMRGCCQMCKGSGLYAGAASGRGLGSVAGMPPMRGISKKFVNVSKKLMGGEIQALASQPMAANYAFRYAR
jgi:hypothetical protein